MFVSRNFCLDNNLVPVATLVVKGEDSPHRGLLLDLVEDDRLTDDMIDDIDIFGGSIELDDDSKLFLLPPHKVRPIKKLRNRLIGRGSSTISSKFKQPPSFSDDDDDIQPSFDVNNYDDDEHNDISATYIFGMKGLGKSFHATAIAREYKRLFPHNNIVYISPVCDNKNLLSMGVITLNCLDPDKAEENFVDLDTRVTPDMFRDSLVIFDDIESLDGDPELKKIKSGVYSLMNKFLIYGRHQNTNLIVIRHNAANYRDTKSLLADCDRITVFPKGNVRDIELILDKYCRLTREQIKRILSIKSRTITIYRKSPVFVVAEHEAYVL